ncbi:MAG: ABC transporter ATP-binding protein [Burkholderiales bacterium]|nr:ABC transporter ATP-binding protein [Burkholderiales bacterium]
MLRLEEVRCTYGKVVALHAVTLEVCAGELVTLIGANGAGKSTTLKTVSGIVNPAAGRILFDGVDITAKTPEQILRLGIAHCPEGRRVFPHMTVLENLEMGAYVRRGAQGVAVDLEATFGHFPILKERAKQAAGTLSGGEQQMLAIGRALMSRPRLILFDEPSLGLAPFMVEAMFRIIEGIRGRGTTVLMVEQNANLALRVADRAYVMETGRIVLEGKAGSLLEDPHVRRAYLGG